MFAAAQAARKEPPSTQMKMDRYIQKYTHTDPLQKKLVKSIALNLIVDCDIPYNIVNRSGFHRFLNDIDPRYNTIDR